MGQFLTSNKAHENRIGWSGYDEYITTNMRCIEGFLRSRARKAPLHIIGIVCYHLGTGILTELKRANETNISMRMNIAECCAPYA